MNKYQDPASNCMNLITPTPMKIKTLTTIMVVLAGLLSFTVLPQKALAGHDSYQRRIIRNCSHCHSPVYSYRVISYYDSCGRPFYRWVTQSHSRCGSRHRISRSYGVPYYSGSYYNRGSNCRPRRGFSFSFGRH